MELCVIYKPNSYETMFYYGGVESLGDYTMLRYSNKGKCLLELPLLDHEFKSCFNEEMNLDLC